MLEIFAEETPNKNLLSTIRYLESPNRGFWSVTGSIFLLHCDRSSVQNPETIKRFLLELCGVIGMKPYGDPWAEIFGEGKLRGCTGVQTIHTSSITVHCDHQRKLQELPVNDTGEQDHINQVMVDIISCAKFDYSKALAFCLEFFGAKYGSMNLSGSGIGKLQLPQT